MFINRDSTRETYQYTYLYVFHILCIYIHTIYTHKYLCMFVWIYYRELLVKSLIKARSTSNAGAQIAQAGRGEDHKQAETQQE